MPRKNHMRWFKEETLRKNKKDSKRNPSLSGWHQLVDYKLLLFVNCILQYIRKTSVNRNLLYEYKHIINIRIRVISKCITVLISNLFCWGYQLLNDGGLRAKLFVAIAVLRLSKKEHSQPFLWFLCGAIYSNLIDLSRLSGWGHLYWQWVIFNWWAL